MIGRVSTGCGTVSDQNARKHRQRALDHVHQIARLPELGAAQRREVFFRMQYASRTCRGEMEDGVQLRKVRPLFKSGWQTSRAANLHGVLI